LPPSEISVLKNVLAAKLRRSSSSNKASQHCMQLLRTVKVSTLCYNESVNQSVIF